MQKLFNKLLVIVIGFLCAFGYTVCAEQQPLVWLPFDGDILTQKGTLAMPFAVETGKPLSEKRGIHGGCLFLDGSTSLKATTLPKEFPQGVASWTVSAWIRVALDCSLAGGWVSWGVREQGRGNSLRLNGLNSIHNYWNNYDLTVSADGVGNGLWHYVVATADGHKRAVYMDGILCGEDEAKPNIDLQMFLIGRTMYDAHFRGWLDELKVFDYAFTEDEVFAHFKDELSKEAMKHDLPAPTISSREVKVSPDKISNEGITVRLKVNLDNVNQSEVLYSLGPIKLVLRMAGEEFYDQAYGNYVNFKMADGTCPVLEATITKRAGRVGLPLGYLVQAGKSLGEKEVILNYSPVHWSIIVDGKIDDEAPLPQDKILWSDVLEAKIHSKRVTAEETFIPAQKNVLPIPSDARVIEKSIQYWTPSDHNTWVGDVAPGFLLGKMHVFYLIDRRHHGSGGGTGRHQFAHLSSEDLIHWVEHPLAVSVCENWQTCGTGTPFVKDGNLALAFGWHTSRYPNMEDKPIGGTYAISADGIHFVNSGEIVSDAQNPSIYNAPAGADWLYELVTSYGGSIGIFHSKDLKEWKLFDAKLPFRGDCPSLFDWHGHRYLLQGFFNMAFSEDGTPGSFVNWSNQSDALYDGLGVPMVAKWKDDRRLYMGWLSHIYGWGGWLVFREVVYYPDGHLGLKWVPEIKPPCEIKTFNVGAGQSFEKCFDPVDEKGVAIKLVVTPKTQEAMWVSKGAEANVMRPFKSENFKIGGVRGLDKDYQVRVIAWYDAKSGVTIFDAEIAGQRTLITRRAGKFVEK